MLKERLQVLIDRDQRERLEQRARERGTSVATLVREAIDASFPKGTSRQDAASAILNSPPMPVPDDPEDLLAELREIRGGRS